MRKIKGILFIVAGLSALYLFLDHIIKFTPHDYFYEANPGINYYVGVNIVSAWADLSFFTYHTIILFGLWCVLYGVSDCFNLNQLNHFTRHNSVITFIFTNYLITTVLYTIFELTSGNITFGLYDTSLRAIHNLGTNILGHYGYFIIILIVYLKIETDGVVKNKHLLIMSCYVFVYYWYVLITGRLMYKIEWYPYPIFDTFALFGKRLDSFIELPILLIIACSMTCCYYYLLKLMTKLKKR